MNWFKRIFRPVKIPGGWRVGMECYFSPMGTEFFCQGCLGIRVVGVIEDYDPKTNILTIRYKGRVFHQEHSVELGGISVVMMERK